MKYAMLLAAATLLAATNSFSQSKMTASLTVKHTANEIDVASLDDAAWGRAESISIRKYWSDAPAPLERQFTARLLWSKTALYVRFEAAQTEPLVVSEKADTSQKLKGLWDRDVCEIFIAPNRAERNRYYEFEIAPNGEWIDLGIEVTPKERKTDWAYNSGMASAARIDKDKVVMAIKIPFAALGRTPKAGDVWLGNLFRCVGRDPTRGYLAWQPTKTKEPAFHVPKAFGEFRFTK